MLIAALSACAKKSQEQAAATSNDSLLASNPVEQPQGNLAPQTEYQPQEQPKSGEPPAQKSKPARSPVVRHSEPAAEPASRGVTLESGTPINISVSAQITSENANVGDSWSGEVKENVIAGNTVVIPAGSRVDGVVTGVKPAEKGSRAFLVLGVRSVDVNGKSYNVDATADSIIAGSTRARNVGAIAGGAAAGALLGKAIGGSSKGAIVGGLLGGAAASGAVAASKGYQATVKEGTVITFNVRENVRIRS
jgi:hypothetical protein